MTNQFENLVLDIDNEDSTDIVLVHIYTHKIIDDISNMNKHWSNEEEVKKAIVNESIIVCQRSLNKVEKKEIISDYGIGKIFNLYYKLYNFDELLEFDEDDLMLALITTIILDLLLKNYDGYSGIVKFLNETTVHNSKVSSTHRAPMA